MKTTLITLTLMGLLIALPACSEASPPQTETAQSQQTTVTHIDAKQADAMVSTRPDITILDVRTPKEYTAGHISGAININYRAADFATQLQSLDPDKEYLIHCASGGRSTASLKTFKKLGFSHIVHMDGGIKAWNKAGLPTVK